MAATEASEAAATASAGESPAPAPTEGEKPSESPAATEGEKTGETPAPTDGEKKGEPESAAEANKGKEGEAAQSSDDKAAAAKAILAAAAIQAPPGLTDGDAPPQAPTGQSPAAKLPVASSAPEDDIFSRLPQSHKQCLRQYYQDPSTGEWQPYFVGSLKSFSSKSGYGFVACPRAHQYWNTDVFIHKNQVPVPWHMGQPIEFAVLINGRGQPQATDCLWLPQITPSRPTVARAPYPKQQAGYPGPPAGSGVRNMNNPSGGSLSLGTSRPQVSTAAAQAALNVGPPPAPAEFVRNKATGPFYLGTMKSFSSSQGYGFIQCDDTWKIHSRDIYFDRSQIPQFWCQGQTVEFQVGQNAKGQPQARHLTWDAVPLLPPESGKDIPPGPEKHKHSSSALAKLHKLLRLLNDGDQESAIVASIDAQGVEKATPDVVGTGSNFPDVDYVNFVLDRINIDGPGMKKIKDFVKMILLLMLAKMLRKPFDATRVKQLLRWLTLLADDIDAGEKQVKDHYNDVVSQIEANLRGTLKENADYEKVGASDIIEKVLTALKSKSSIKAPPGL